jgi:hypothetical protein
MTNLGKAGIFAIFAFICLVSGIVTDIRRLQREEGRKIFVPLMLFSSGFVCAGVGVMLFGEYLVAAVLDS